jgi:hypothetical protein
MYPEQGVPENFVVRVLENQNGAAVASGRAVAVLNSTPDFLIGNPSAGLNNINGNYGLVRRVISIDIQNGVATFPKEQLILGANYNLEFINLRNAAGQYLDPMTNNFGFTPGQDRPELVVFAPLPAVNPQVRTSNNERDNSFPSDLFVNNLVVTFPYPVELCSDIADADWFNFIGSNEDGDLVVAAPPSTGQQVNISFNGDNTEMTLAPIFGSDNRANDPGDSLGVSFDDVYVRVRGSSSCTYIWDLRMRDTGNSLNAQIYVREINP